MSYFVRISKDFSKVPPKIYEVVCCKLNSSSPNTKQSSATSKVDRDAFLPSPLFWGSALTPDGSGTGQAGRRAALGEEHRSGCVGPQVALLLNNQLPPG